MTPIVLEKRLKNLVEQASRLLWIIVASETLPCITTVESALPRPFRRKSDCAREEPRICR